jgi:dTDP-4-amino-4,6-dideoxygalactose transaminase
MHPSTSTQRDRRDVLRVPFVDLGAVNSLVRSEILAELGLTIDRGDFINGDAVQEFESRFAEFCGRRHCVGVASGLDALRLSLLASGLEPGAGVIVPASTFAATFEAVLQAGGTPVVVDVGQSDYCLDIQQAENAALAGRATHILPVHLYGQLADMGALAPLARAHGLQIVEDACQAHGACRDGLSAGAVGEAAAFSFYPTKNLGAFGDAGALVTDDDDLAAHARALRVHGEVEKYRHQWVGYTARLDTFQAIVLLKKLPRLEEWNRQRRTIAALYTEALSGIQGLHLPPQPRGSEPVWHLYVVRSRERERLAAFLAERGVGTARHYPEPSHLAPAYRGLGFGRGDFPVTEALATEGLSLPLYPGLEAAQIAWVCESVRDYFRGGSNR